MKNIQMTKEQMGQLAAGVLFGAFFIYVYFVYFWMPLGKTITEKTKKVAKIEADILNAKAQKAKYKNLEGKLVSLQLEKDAAQKKLPRERKLPDLLRTVTDLSKKYKVNVRSMAPAGSAQVEYFLKVSYSISVSGNYHDLGRFLTAIGIEERILTPENVGIRATGNPDASCEVSFTLVAYQYNG
ncbi:MAG TPA: hypothetical protein DCZ92_13250 [Elusimicrobia bacterium]|nr:MAG: hypothetical protein A2016_02315 [Elusimicrobia bacterium GWF2_62_30]HBA61749.1 hypothetical protein [Elusimicrobiota bacterium]